MLDELRDLYQEVILDHGRNPRNLRHPAEANRHARGENPICGDSLVVHLTVDDDWRIADVAFEGRGCAISVASASLMTEVLRGRSADEAKVLFESFHRMCTTNEETEAANGADEDALDRLRVLSGVREFPMRVKCATLAWHTMNAAMAGEAEVSTE